MRANDPLGYLIPPARLHPSLIEHSLASAMDQKRYTSGIGVPSAPTRYVVAMNPADRAAQPPGTEDRLARALERRADADGMLILGPVEVEFSCEPDLQLGRPRVWCGYAGENLLVLAGADAALEIFARS